MSANLMQIANRCGVDAFKIHQLKKRTYMQRVVSMNPNKRNMSSMAQRTHR